MCAVTTPAPTVARFPWDEPGYPAIVAGRRAAAQRANAEARRLARELAEALADLDCAAVEAGQDDRANAAWALRWAVEAWLGNRPQRS